MAETTNPELSFVDDFAASVWAILPEEFANTLAGVKKDFLTNLRSTVDSMIDHDLNFLERTVENARRKRNECKKDDSASEATGEN